MFPKIRKSVLTPPLKAPIVGAMAAPSGLRIQGPQHEGFIFTPGQNSHFEACTTVLENLMVDSIDGEIKGV